MFKNKRQRFKDLKIIGICWLMGSFLSFSQVNQQISVEKIIIDRIKYNLGKIDMLIRIFSGYFSNNKNMDILKYGVCKYLLPRYLYTNALQLLLHQLVLNLEEKCPECFLHFYPTVEETPTDFQTVSTLFNFVKKFADYKLKIQALHTLLYEIDLYSEDIEHIFVENNNEKLMDYITLLEAQIINTFTESFIKWDQDKKECEIKYKEDMYFDKCLSDGKISLIDKGDINCGCDNRIPYDPKDYFNVIASYPLDTIFGVKAKYSARYLAKLKEALNFYYTFTKYIELNFLNFYNLLKSYLDENEKIIYNMCVEECKNSSLIDRASAVEECSKLSEEQKCREKGCVWCEHTKKCRITLEYCYPFTCKNVEEFRKSKIKVSCKINSNYNFAPLLDREISPSITCRNKIEIYSSEQILKFCKKFKSVYVCPFLSIHKIANKEYPRSNVSEDCSLFNLCKCFDEQEIEGAKDDIELPKCELLLPR
ncbi:MAG: hypothetical protein ACK4NF_00210 [Planctomycetota bacterium]